MALHVVTGPPAAGKTTYVRQHAKRGDVVVDLDAIAMAITPDPDDHHHPLPVLRTAQRARQAAITEALRHCQDTDVWIIHTQPRPEALARYAEHGASVVTIDPGRETVMARIAEQRPHTTRAVAARWYASAGAEPSAMVGDASRAW